MSSAKMFGSNSAEMSKKLRAAIKAKLEELGVYVDEELPDYIMVMIANRKEKSQMKEDLLLFLGKSTNKFVDWLFEIFERLQSAGATSLSDSGPLQQSKRKEQSFASKKENSKDSEVEKRISKREREGDGKHSEPKDPSKRKEKERIAEKEKREARVVKSKPSFHRRALSRSPSHERTHTKKKNDVKSDGKEKEKNVIATGGGKTSFKEGGVHIKERSLSDSLEAKKRSAENVSQKHLEEKDSRNSPTHIQPREKRIHADEHSGSPRHVAKHTRNPSITRVIDSDEEERLAEEESRHELYGKKVLSSAVLKMKQSEPIKTVPSKIIVKRKLPEKENAKNARGAQSLFLKAIKEAGRMTRTASQIAGYGGNVLCVKKGGVKPSVSAEECKSTEEQEEAIQIDDDIIMEESLVVTTSGAVKNEIRCQVDDRTFAKRSKMVTKPAASELVASEKNERALSGGSVKIGTKNLLVTLKKADIGNVLRTVETNEEPDLSTRNRKRRSDTTGITEDQREIKQISEEPNVVRPKKLRNSDTTLESKADSCDAVNEVINNGNVHEASSIDKQGGNWDRQIPVEEDSSDDDEAQIDAVLASAHTITVGFDEDSSVPSPAPPALCVGEVSQPPQKPNIAESSVSQAVDPVSTIVSGEKIMERCKFWPNCRLEEACIYIHPTKPCSNFPNCKFGDRCIYLHFPCKFDRSCTNPHCPYVHSSKTSVVATTVSASISSTSISTGTTTTAIAAPLNASIACKYGGKCTNPSCMYKHPKLCRFGERCTNRNCYFRHVNMLPTSTLKSAAVDKYKWKATIPA